LTVFPTVFPHLKTVFRIAFVFRIRIVFCIATLRHGRRAAALSWGGGAAGAAAAVFFLAGAGGSRLRHAARRPRRPAEKGRHGLTPRCTGQFYVITGSPVM
jgi:hypothetical protein